MKYLSSSYNVKNLFTTSGFIGICLAFCLCTGIAAPVIKTRQYPAIRKAVFNFTANSSNPTKSDAFIIRDLQGRPAYNLSVAALSEDGRTIDSLEMSFVSVGRYVMAYDRKYEPNLLDSDPWGHGVGKEVIFPEDLCTANRKNPIKGARRNFTFRRMRIIVAVDKAKFSKDFVGFRALNANSERVGGLTDVRMTITFKLSISEMDREPAYNYGEVNKCRKLR